MSDIFKGNDEDAGFLVNSTEEPEPMVDATTYAEALIELINELSDSEELDVEAVEYIVAETMGLSEEHRAPVLRVLYSKTTDTDGDGLPNVEALGDVGTVGPVSYTKYEPETEEDDDDAPIDHPKLDEHDIDIPEEPEFIHVRARTWNAQKNEFEEVDLGAMWLVPSGCERPNYLSPYESKASLRSTLPRDREKDANLFALYQNSGWRSRRWAMEKLSDDDDEGLNISEMDKQIVDDIPLILSLQGKPDPSKAPGVAGTPGAATGTPGSSNGAPPPPTPGPGRGNMYAPGDNLAE